MDGWTVLIWVAVCAGGALLFMKLVADAVLLLTLKLKHLEHAARRVEAQQQRDDDQAIETLQAA